MRSSKSNIYNAVLAVKMVDKESIYGYHENTKLPFLKITMLLPRMIAAAKRLLEKGMVDIPDVPPSPFPAYESNIDFEIR